ncbi:hypothetical protein EV13_2327 [Prochlorococcus sp. MIT 0702]|nr:hypothetical protein EV12_1953 [Prochlorococcus sp. MIT 0701]KGG26866.1 hypothetical protein EV13_2327 [Prochlorococcus sp. MIT 0702]KGG36142.1 hypothetical protein EV14_0551 [Prochlorococcus sp. MIT 0703]
MILLRDRLIKSAQMNTVPINLDLTAHASGKEEDWRAINHQT